MGGHQVAPGGPTLRGNWERLGVVLRHERLFDTRDHRAGVPGSHSAFLSGVRRLRRFRKVTQHFCLSVAEDVGVSGSGRRSCAVVERP